MLRNILCGLLLAIMQTTNASSLEPTMAVNIFDICKQDVETFASFLDQQKKQLHPQDFEDVINTTEYNATILYLLTQQAFETNHNDDWNKLQTLILYNPSGHGILHAIILWYFTHYNQPETFERCTRLLAALQKVLSPYDRNYRNETILDVIMACYVKQAVYPMRIITQMLTILIQYNLIDPTHPCTNNSWTTMDEIFFGYFDETEGMMHERYKELYELFTSHGYKHSWKAQLSICNIL